MLDVTALGELLIDFAPAGIDENGYPLLAAKPGGAPPNFLAALAAYGARTALLSKVGADAFGNLLIGTLKKIGVETRGIIQDPYIFTTLAFVTLDDGGERSFCFARNPGADTRLRPDEVDFPLIDEAKAFHFGTLSLTDEPAKQATQIAVAYAKSKNKLITFDPNLRTSLWDDLGEAKAQILWGLSQADVVKISDDEVEFLWNCDEFSGAQKLLDSYNIKLAMVTLGAKGAYLANKKAAASVGCPAVKPVDTTGAGDIFGGGAVSRILKLGKDPGDLDEGELNYITKFATVAASLSTLKAGGLPSVPGEDEVLALTCNLL